MASGPDGDKSALWDEIEAKYWESIRAVREREDRQITEKHQVKSDDIKLKLVDLYGERSKLSTKLQNVRKQCNDLEGLLQQQEQELETTRTAILADRKRSDEQQREWFRKYRRGGEAYQAMSDDDDEVTVVDEETAAAHTKNRDQEEGRPSRPNHSSTAGQPADGSEPNVRPSSGPPKGPLTIDGEAL